MMKTSHARIIGIGAYYPQEVQTNKAFHATQFLKDYDVVNPKSGSAIATKFEEITEIRERRYATSGIRTSDMAAMAAESAINDAEVDRELIDYIIVAHNFGDVDASNGYIDQVPNLAARVKAALRIQNPRCVAYDLLFGCPGWVQGLIQADYYLRTDEVARVLVIGADTVARVADPADMDYMLYSDGAGAVLLESKEANQGGIIGHRTVSNCAQELSYLRMDKAFDRSIDNERLYLKMNGRRVYRYAVETVPQLILDCLQANGLSLDEVKYVLIHQANGKMLRVMASRLFELADRTPFDASVFPMNVQQMGNNSVATIPTLLDELSRKELNDRGLRSGDLLVFASVGAGMHANCLLYRVG